LNPAAQRDLPGKPEYHLRDQENERAGAERRQGCTGPAVPPEGSQNGPDKADPGSHGQPGGSGGIEWDEIGRDILDGRHAVALLRALQIALGNLGS
jgi:hypothetical protein